MESLTKEVTLSNLSYPVFKLGTIKPEYIEGVTMYSIRYIHEDNTEVSKYYIVDDSSIVGATLAKRRLVLTSQGIRLKALGTAVFFLGDLIKIATPKLWFIDSNGLVFRYIKQSKAKLTFKKIINKQLIPSGGAILEVEGIPSRFKCLFAPRASETYAGILKLGLSYILYGVYEEKHQDTWRKI